MVMLKGQGKPETCDYAYEQILFYAAMQMYEYRLLPFLLI